MSDKSIFDTLYEIDVGPYVETFKGTTIDYVEWSTSWRMVKQVYPKAQFIIHLYDEVSNVNKVPYLVTALGYFVVCSVKIEDQLETDYYDLETVSDRGGTPSVKDVATAHQRCLCKCLARFGFALKLWEKKEREKIKNSDPGANVKLSEEAKKEASKPKSFEKKEGAVSKEQSMELFKLICKHSFPGEKKVTPNMVREVFDRLKIKGYNTYEVLAEDFDRAVIALKTNKPVEPEEPMEMPPPIDADMDLPF
jgi:hypothetical protein